METMKHSTTGRLHGKNYLKPKIWTIEIKQRLMSGASGDSLTREYRSSWDESTEQNP